MADDTEYWEKLKEKLAEEFTEFKEAESLRLKKAEERGKLEKKVILEEG